MGRAGGTGRAGACSQCPGSPNPARGHPRPPPEVKALGAQGTAPPPLRFHGARGAGWLAQRQEEPGARRADAYYSAQGRQQGGTWPPPPSPAPAALSPCDQVASLGLPGLGMHVGLAHSWACLHKLVRALLSGSCSSPAVRKRPPPSHRGVCALAWALWLFGKPQDHKLWPGTVLGTPSSWWLRRLWHPTVLRSLEHSRPPLLSPFQGLTP